MTSRYCGMSMIIIELILWQRLLQNNFSKIKLGVGGCSSVAEHLHSMCTSSQTQSPLLKKKKKKEYLEIAQRARAHSHIPLQEGLGLLLAPHRPALHYCLSTRSNPQVLYRGESLSTAGIITKSERGGEKLRKA